MSLVNLTFFENFLPEKMGDAWYKARLDVRERRNIPPQYRTDARRLRKQIESMPADREFENEFDGLRLQVARQQIRIMAGMRLMLLLAYMTCLNAFAGQPTPDMAACFQGAAAWHHVNPVVIEAIARVESGFNPQAIHRNGNGTLDYGIMQINSSWFPQLAQFGIRPELLADPCTNIYIGAWILAKNMRDHGNTWKAIGKYNAAGDVAGARYERKVYGAVMALKGGQ